VISTRCPAIVALPFGLKQPNGLCSPGEAVKSQLRQNVEDAQVSAMLPFAKR
jgi:hypothetical protein